MSGGYLEGLVRIEFWIEDINVIAEDQQRAFTEEQVDLINKFNKELLEIRAILNDFDYAVEGDKSFDDFFEALKRRTHEHDGSA